MENRGSETRECIRLKLRKEEGPRDLPLPILMVMLLAPFASVLVLLVIFWSLSPPATCLKP
jgi:hypothetical protein